jgi:hypothetical protein
MSFRHTFTMQSFIINKTAVYEAVHAMHVLIEPRELSEKTSPVLVCANVFA